MLFIVRTGSVDPLTAGAGAERRAEARRSAKHGEAQMRRGVHSGVCVRARAWAGRGRGAVAAAACVRAVAWVQRGGVKRVREERGGTVQGAGERGAVRRRVQGAPMECGGGCGAHRRMRGVAQEDADGGATEGVDE